MKDREKLNNGRASKLKCPTNYNPTSFTQFIADLQAGIVYVDITANNSDGSDAGVSEPGTALNKANLLSDTTAAKFGYEANQDPTVDDILEILGDSYATGFNITLLANGWTGSSAPYTQSIVNSNIRGISAVPRWIVNPASAVGPSAKQMMLDQSAYIGLVQTAEGQVTFTCYADKPTVNIDIILGE